MQIRYLEAMQAMAKSANSKIIFMPGPTDSGNLMARALEDEGSTAGPSTGQYDQHADPIQHVVNTRVLENM